MAAAADEVDHGGPEGPRADLRHPAPQVDEAARAAALMKRATYASVGVALILLASKAVALWYTGSMAMLAAMVDSGLDALASLLNLLAVRHAVTPPDAEHRFGHGKAEALAGLGQAAFIFGSAAFLAIESVSRIVDPRPVSAGGIGIAVILFSMAATLGLVAYQRHVIARTKSLAISADELHYKGDLLMNAGVILALVLAALLGIVWADPLIGLAIAGYIAYAAWQIVRQSFDQLMDREFPDEDRDRIRVLATAHPEVADIHDLRTRSSGVLQFIQFHLELDPAMTLERAHAIADAVEAEIRKGFPKADILIHQDPAGRERLIDPDSALDKEPRS